MEKLQSEGYRCEVCRSFDEFRNVVDNYMFVRKKKEKNKRKKKRKEKKVI